MSAGNKQRLERVLEQLFARRALGRFNSDSEALQIAGVRE